MDTQEERSKKQRYSQSSLLFSVRKRERKVLSCVQNQAIDFQGTERLVLLMLLHCKCNGFQMKSSHEKEMNSRLSKREEGGWIRWGVAWRKINSLSLHFSTQGEQNTQKVYIERRDQVLVKMINLFHWFYLQERTFEKRKLKETEGRPSMRETLEGEWRSNQRKENLEEKNKK